MAESTTTRLGLARWSADTDSPNRTEFDTSFANLEANAAGWLPAGTLANRPAAAAAYDRFMYWAHDTDEAYMCIDSTGAGAWTWHKFFPSIVEDIATFSKEGTLSVVTGKSRFYLPFAATLIGVRAAVNTAPTGASIIVDLLKNGTTVFPTTPANRPTIAASTNSSTEAVPDTLAVGAGDYLTANIAQVGSTVAGADLTVLVRYQRA